VNEMEAPIYIKINEFDNVMKTLKEVKDKTAQAREKLEAIKKIAQQEDMAVREWEERMNKMDHNLDEIHSFLNSKTR